MDWRRKFLVLPRGDHLRGITRPAPSPLPRWRLWPESRGESVAESRSHPYSLSGKKFIHVQKHLGYRDHCGRFRQLSLLQQAFPNDFLSGARILASNSAVLFVKHFEAIGSDRNGALARQTSNPCAIFLRGLASPSRCILRQPLGGLKENRIIQ